MVMEKMMLMAEEHNDYDCNGVRVISVTPYLLFNQYFNFARFALRSKLVMKLTKVNVRDTFK